MSRIRRHLARLAAVAALLLAAPAAMAQQEIPPPAGTGRVVVVVSGMSGPDHYTPVAQAIAALGYDVVLLDGNDMAGSHGAALRAAIIQAQKSAHGLPGKVGLVGFSLGGAVALYFGSQWNDLVAVDIDWYPATKEIADDTAFARRLRVPVLMFAGGQDNYRACCLADKARALAAAAAAQNAAFDLVVYPDADHDFVRGGRHYNASDYADALRQTAARLQAALAH